MPTPGGEGKTAGGGIATRFTRKTRGSPDRTLPGNRGRGTTTCRPPSPVPVPCPVPVPPPAPAPCPLPSRNGWTGAGGAVYARRGGPQWSFRPPRCSSASGRSSARSAASPPRFPPIMAPSTTFSWSASCKGAFMFLADLAPAHHPARVDFIALSRYGDGTAHRRGAADHGPPHRHRRQACARRRGHRRHRPDAGLPDADPRRPRAGLARLLCPVAQARPHAGRRRIGYLGFDIPDVWVVGYGIDCADQYRNLPYIGTVAPGST